MRVGLLLIAVALSAGCAIDPYVNCRMARTELTPLGLVQRNGRIWRVSEPDRGLSALMNAAGQCEARRGKPIAFVQDSTGVLIGMARRRSTPRLAEQPGVPLSFDDFIENRNWKGSTRSCRPGDLADLRESHSIADINGRRVTTASDSLTDADLKYASVWLWRCIRAVDPIAWIDPQGRLIAVYHHKRIDRFE